MKTLPVCLTALLLAAAASGAVTETIRDSHPLTANGALTLTDVNGAIVITAWDRNEVEVEAVKKADNAEDLARIHIKIAAQPDRIDITTEHERVGLLGREVRGEVRYTVHVPAGARLERIETVNSNVIVTGVQGGANVRTVNGGIRITGLEGGANLHSVNGGLRAEFTRLPADASVALETVNGGCEVLLPAGAGARIDARTVNGGVHCDIPIAVTTGGRGSVHGTLGAGGADVKLRSVNGGVTIRGR